MAPVRPPRTSRPFRRAQTTCVDVRPHPDVAEEFGDSGAGGCPDEQTRHEDAAGPLSAERGGGRDGLEDRQHAQRPPRQGRLVPKNASDEGLTRAEHLRVDQAEHRNGPAEEQGPHPGAEPVGLQLEPVEGRQEEPRGADSSKAENGVEQQLAGIVECIRCHLEREIVPDHRAADDGSDDRGDDDGVHMPECELLEDHLHREEHAGDRCVEGGADAGPCTGRHEHSDVVLAQMGDTAYPRTDRRADLSDRALTTCGAATADGHAGDECEGASKGPEH